MSQKQEVGSRLGRLVFYLRHNITRMAVDLTILTAWTISAWAIFNWFSLPTWFFYVILFTGVIAYSRITPTWERPYRSPDYESED